MTGNNFMRSAHIQNKTRDKLRSIIAAVRAKEFPVAVQFVNFRD